MSPKRQASYGIGLCSLSRRALTHSDADQFGADELLRTRRAVIEFWARCSFPAGTGAFVERWIVRLIDVVSRTIPRQQ